MSEKQKRKNDDLPFELSGDIHLGVIFVQGTFFGLVSLSTLEMWPGTIVLAVIMWALLLYMWFNDLYQVYRASQRSGVFEWERRGAFICFRSYKNKG